MDINPKIQKAIDLRVKEGSLEKAREALLELLKDEEIKQDKDQHTMVLISLSSVERDLGNTDLAYQYLDQADDIAENNVLKIKIASLIGYLNLKTGTDSQKVAGAIEQVVQRINLEKEDDKDKNNVLADVYALIGNCYANEKVKDWHQAMDAYLKALQYAWSIDYYSRVATVLGDMGLVMQYGYRNIPSALGFYSWQEQIAKEYNKHAYVAVLFRLGRIWEDEGNPYKNVTLAEEYYFKSLNIARQEGWRREQGDVLEKLADLYLKQGNKDKALESIDEVIDIFIQIGYIDQLERCKKLKSEI